MNSTLGEAICREVYDEDMWDPTCREVYDEDIGDYPSVDGAVNQPEETNTNYENVRYVHYYFPATSADPDPEYLEDKEESSDTDEENDEDPEELNDRTLFSEMDEHAKNADKQVAASYSRLTDYLREKFPEQKRKHELYLVRGLLVWLSHNQDCVNPGVDAGMGNPLQLIKALSSQQIKLRKAFHVLCENNDITCEVVEGTVRGAVGYEVGDTDCKVRGQWNVVTIDGKQRLIHAVRACSATIGYETGGWIQKEADGVAMTKIIESDRGRRVTRFNDFWFCTDPWEFIHYCYPDESTWQLLPEEKEVKTLQEFLLLPLVTEWYFRHGLKLISEYACLLKADGDKTEITFEIGNQDLKKLHYSLFVKESAESSTDNTERMVLDWMDQKKGTFSFELRFPMAGTYKLQIDADTKDGLKERLSICDFKIVCKTPTKNFRRLPIEPPYGWGCTHKAAEFGLVNPSLTSPTIPMTKMNNKQRKPENTATLMFTIKKEMVNKVNYNSSLHGCDYTKEDHSRLQKYVRTDVDEDLLQLTVQATVPTDGEFALVVEATLAEVKRPNRDMKTQVCAYLLTTLEHRYITATINYFEALKIPKDISVPHSPGDRARLSSEFVKSTGKRIAEAKGILASKDRDLRHQFITHLQVVLTSETQRQVADMIQRLLQCTRREADD